MITERGNGFYAWNGKLYSSDIIRACIRPKAKAIGKMVACHIIENENKVKINEVASLRFLLEEPNPYMTGQVLQEKITIQLSLNNNAFILIVRDNFRSICQLYPVPAMEVEIFYISSEFYYKFTFFNGKTITARSTEVIHLRDDFNDNDIFGESPSRVLLDMMTVVKNIDQSIIQAIKNSGTIRWLLKFNTTLRPEDLDAQVRKFSKDYLDLNSDNLGVAAVDSKADAQRIEPKDYVPNVLYMERITKRIYAFFNTNEKIVHSAYSENEWNSYYESVIEPLAIQMGNEFSRKIFSREERMHGNRIHFETSNLQCASINTKLNLVQMVDRGALTPNEWRKVLNLPPVEGGDKPIRRLDTDTIEMRGE